MFLEECDMQHAKCSLPEAASRSTTDFTGMELLENRLLMRHATWGYSAINSHQDQAVAAFPNLTGAGQSIAIIDTGVDYNAPTMGGGFGRHHKVQGGYNFIDNNGDPMDDVGHGTAVATIAAGLAYSYRGRVYQGVAPGANIVALKVDNGSDVLNPTRVTQAFQWVLDHQVKYNITTVNISEGFLDFAVKTQGASFSNLLLQCKQHGIFIAASSGNDGLSNAVEYPGSDPSVISVGSTDVNNHISSFTNSAPALDLLAPGETVAVPYLDDSGSIYYTYSEGTSFAAPYVAGTAALLHQADPHLTTTQILGVLKSSGTRIVDHRNGLTFSELNIYQALKSA